MPKATENPLPMSAACRLLSGYGSGAGFLVTHDGLVATCAHGVYAEQTLRVELSGGTLHDARVVAYRPERDLALLKIDGVAGLPHARLGDPKDYPRGSRFAVIGLDQLPESVYAPVYIPVGKRWGVVLGPLALEVGYAGILRVFARPASEAGDRDEAPRAEDPAFDVVMTTRTDQVRPGYSGAMVCAPDGAVVGIHTAALNLGGFGQEISAVELRALLAEHGHRPKDAPKKEKLPKGAAKRWRRVIYALQCVEMDSQRIDRGDQAYHDDLAYFDAHAGPTPEDSEVLIARAYAHRDLQQWGEALAVAREAVAGGGITAGWILRDLAEHEEGDGDGASIAAFLGEQVEAMPDLGRRVALRTQLVGLLNDRREFEAAIEWGAKGEEDAHDARDSAEFLLQYARAYHGAGRQTDADTWLLRAVWARDAKGLSDAAVARIAADSDEPRTRWYALRRSLAAISSGDGGPATLGPLRRLAEAQGATEAAAVFASLERAFAPAPSPTEVEVEAEAEAASDATGDGPEEAPDHV